MKSIKISTDFSDVPLGRYSTDSDYSGERFREDFLRPALNSDEKVSVNIDGAEGYGSSFLEEAFGGLIRKGPFTREQLKKCLIIVNNDASFRIYRDLIWKYIDEAKPDRKNQGKK